MTKINRQYKDTIKAAALDSRLHHPHREMTREEEDRQVSRAARWILIPFAVLNVSAIVTTAVVLVSHHKALTKK